MRRHLDWQGCLNARDLGGLRLSNGAQTSWRAVVRSDNLSQLTDAGCQALRAHGIGTIVDLRHDSEREANPPRLIDGVETIPIPLEDLSDIEFWQKWGGLICTPLYYKAFLERFPGRVASVLSAIAAAGPGGVLFHCGIGRDRTGLIALLMLALAGVEHEQIASDYELSEHRLCRDVEQNKINELLARENTTIRQSILDLLACIDVEAYMRTAGLSADEINLLRNKLTFPGGADILPAAGAGGPPAPPD